MGSGGRGHGRGEERVEAGEEAGDPAAEALDVLHGDQPVGRGDLLAGLPQRPGQRLDLVLARLAADAPDPVAQDPRRGGVDHRADGRADLGRKARPVRLGDLVAERGAQPGGVLGGRDAVRVAVVAVGRSGGVADPQPAGIGAHLVEERPGRRRRPVRVAQVGPGRGVEQRGAVPDRTGERVLGRAAARDVAVLGPERVAGPGRLEREQAARRRRVAQRAAQVVAVRERHHARRHRRGRAAAGPAGGALRVPRVAGRAEQHRLARGRHPEFGRAGLAQDDQARPAQPEHELGVEGGHVAGQEAGTLGEAHALHLAGQVLEQVRHPGERTGRAGARLLERPVEDRRDDRVQHRVQRLDPLDGRRHQLGRA